MTGALDAEKILAGVLCGFAIAAQTRAQEVQIPRETGAQIARPAAFSKQLNARAEQTIAAQPAKASVREKESASPKLTIEQMRKAGSLATQRARDQARIEQSSSARVPNSQTGKPEAFPYRPLDRQVREPESIPSQVMDNEIQTAFTKLADGFDFPIGKPDARGYYKARGFYSRGHLGEDWDGIRGGDTDLGDPIYSIGEGVVVFARDCHLGWGNVVIVRHAYREDGAIKNIDSFLRALGQDPGASWRDGLPRPENRNHGHGAWIV